MVNNYPEYAAGVNFKKTDSNGVRHFYSAQVVADPSDETIESKLIKDGVVISEGGPTVEALNVTENGTYSEEGKAYSPVVVNVAGGSSDFSTAEVTIKNSTLSDVNIQVASIALGSITTYIGAQAAQTVNAEIVLYQGASGFDLPDGATGAVVTGDITYDDGYVEISGNGTIDLTE